MSTKRNPYLSRGNGIYGSQYTTPSVRVVIEPNHTTDTGDYSDVNLGYEVTVWAEDSKGTYGPVYSEHYLARWETQSTNLRWVKLATTNELKRLGFRTRTARTSLPSAPSGWQDPQSNMFVSHVRRSFLMPTEDYMRSANAWHAFMQGHDGIYQDERLMAHLSPNRKMFRVLSFYAGTDNAQTPFLVPDHA